MRAKSAIPNWLKLALGIAIAFGIMIRGVNLDSRVFWFDETITSLRIAGYTELELFEETLSDGPISSAELLQYQSVNADRGALDTVQALASADIHHPPLYYVLVRWWADWFGDGVGSVRSLSVVFGLLVLPCAYWVAWELTASPLAGWLAVAIVAVSPVQVIYSQEAREYSLWFLTTLLASGALLRALRHKTRLSWLGYAIAATLGLYSHLFFCLVMVSHGLYVVTQGGLKSRRLAIDYLAASGLAILSFVPWIVLVLRNLQKIQSSMDWVTESNSRAYLIQRWVANFSYLFFDFNANSSSSRLTLAVTGIGVLVTAAAVIYAAVWMLRFLPSRVGWFAITLSGVLAVLLVGSDILAGGFRSGIARYLIPCYLAIQLVLACVLAGWLGGMSGLKLANPSRSRRLAATLLCSLLLVGILSGANATQARTWWQKGSASADNLNLLPWLERAERPLVLVTVDRAIATGEMLALSHLLPPEAQLQWWDSQHPLPDSVREFDSVFVYGMTDESEPFGNAGEASFESLFQGKRRSLWQVQQRSSAQLPNIRGRNGYLWGNVAIGGGGYVTNVYLHPGQPDLVYIKTDVGGFYRWLGSERRWLPLTDWLSQSQHNLYGGEALALDPNDPERVYIAAGKFLNSGKGALYRSSDRGVTWTKLPLELPMGGNEDKRWIGERLAIDPSNSQVLLFGSRRDGLWRSADAGSSWQAIEFPGNLQTDIGISDVRFDPVAPQRVYATAYGDGIYQSDDSGLTWTHLPGSPTRAHRMAIAANPIPTLYVTHAAGVSRYRERAWKDITPRNPATPAFNAIAIDPFEPNRLIAVYDQYHDRANQQRVFVSEDSGENWQVQTAYGNSGAPWWEDAAFGAATAAIAFDPHVPDRVWLTDWSGVWQTSNINRKPTLWQSEVRGHEELVVFALLTPSHGAALVSGVADSDGFNHDPDLNIYPMQTFGGKDGPWFQDTYSLAFCETHPEHWVRVGGNRYNATFGGALSDDGGKTWQAFATFPEDVMPLRVGMSATDSDVLVVTVSEGTALRSSDRGKTWTNVVGLPAGDRGPWYWSQSLAADKVLGQVFYYYAAGTLYRSEDGGTSFAAVNADLPSESWHEIETVPNRPGELWLSLDRAGLYYSSDRGQTFVSIPTVERSYLFALAPTESAETPPVLYVYGDIASLGPGIFRSSDRGQTWQPIDAPEQPIGNDPKVMTASRQQPGVIFIGTGGRGIYYGKPS